MADAYVVKAHAFLLILALLRVASFAIRASLFVVVASFFGPVFRVIVDMPVEKKVTISQSGRGDESDERTAAIDLRKDVDDFETSRTRMLCVRCGCATFLWVAAIVVFVVEVRMRWWND